MPLRGVEFTDGFHRGIDERAHFVAAKGAVLASALHFNESAFAAHHDVHVDVGAHILSVLEVGAHFAVDHADAHGGHAPFDGRRLDAAGGDHPLKGIDDRHGGAGDCGRARAAVGLQHVTVELDGELAPFEIIEHGAHATANESLNFLGTPPNLCTFARRAGVRGAWQHGVLGGEPPFALSFFPAGNAVFDARRAEHARVAKGNEARPFRVGRGAALDGDGAQGQRRTAARTRIKSHGVSRRLQW